MSTWSTGPREAGTTLTANFGDLGYTAGVFGGYGAQFANFYLGGELEAEPSGEADGADRPRWIVEEGKRVKYPDLLLRQVSLAAEEVEEP